MVSQPSVHDMLDTVQSKINIVPYCIEQDNGKEVSDGELTATDVGEEKEIRLTAVTDNMHHHGSTSIGNYDLVDGRDNSVILKNNVNPNSAVLDSNSEEDETTYVIQNSSSRNDDSCTNYMCQVGECTNGELAVITNSDGYFSKSNENQSIQFTHNLTEEEILLFLFENSNKQEEFIITHSGKTPQEHVQDLSEPLIQESITDFSEIAKDGCYLTRLLPVEDLNKYLIDDCIDSFENLNLNPTLENDKCEDCSIDKSTKTSASLPEPKYGSHRYFTKLQNPEVVSCNTNIFGSRNKPLKRKRCLE